MRPKEPMIGAPRVLPRLCTSAQQFTAGDDVEITDETTGTYT